MISDIHLGAGPGNDLLRGPVLRERLGEELRGAERVVLLGDVVELRDRPLFEVLEAAGPFFGWLGEVAAGAEVVLVPGNHDHHLFSSWAESRRLRGGSRPLGLEQRAKATSGPLRVLAKALPGCELELAYPGLWLADGVYATHGHYLDAHLTVPTFERLGVGVVERVVGGLPHGGRSPEDYERAQAPLYAFLFALAQSGGIGGTGASPSARLWSTLSGGATTSQRVRGMLLGSIALPGAIAVANRLGIGRFKADLSLEEIGRATVAAMAETVERLEIGAKTVVFGHTHRAGPLDGESGWEASGGVRLLNTGSWVYSPALVGGSAAASPYWPGTVVVLDGGVLELRRLLEDASHRDLRGALAAE